MIRFFAEGVPAPQGSKRYVGHGRMIENSKKLPAWRATVTQAATATGTTFDKDQALELTCEFVMPRTKAMRNHPAPPMTQKPDADKLLRAVGDALTNSGMIHDDSQIVTIHASKRRAEPGEKTGCAVTVATFNP